MAILKFKSKIFEKTDDFLYETFLKFVFSLVSIKRYTRFNALKFSNRLTLKADPKTTTQKRLKKRVIMTSLTWSLLCKRLSKWIRSRNIEVLLRIAWMLTIQVSNFMFLCSYNVRILYRHVRHCSHYHCTRSGKIHYSGKQWKLHVEIVSHKHRLVILNEFSTKWTSIYFN